MPIECIHMQGARRRPVLLSVLSLLSLSAVAVHCLLSCPLSFLHGYTSRGIQRVDGPYSTLLSQRASKGNDVEMPTFDLEIQTRDNAQKLAEVEAKLNKARAFKLPEQDELQCEFDKLQQESKVLELRNQRASEIASRLDDAWNERRQGAKTEEQLRELARQMHKPPALDDGTASPKATPATTLQSKLTFEKLQAMTDEERLKVAQEAGPAFLVSLAIVAISYWSVTLSILAYVVHESTGHWPNPTELLNADNRGEAAGIFAGFLSMLVLFKPVRIILAMLLTPWTAEHVIPLLPWFASGDR